MHHFVVTPALTLALSLWERGLIPFSLWEKGGDEGRPQFKQYAHIGFEEL
jgi:hypothetical protein